MTRTIYYRVEYVYISLVVHQSTTMEDDKYVVRGPVNQELPEETVGNEILRQMSSAPKDLIALVSLIFFSSLDLLKKISGRSLHK